MTACLIFIRMQKAGELKTVIEDGNAEVANASIQTSMYFDTAARLAISHGMWTFDAKTPLEYLQKNRDYTLNNVIEKIKCPTLVLEAEMDDAFSGGPQKVHDALRCPKKIFYSLLKKVLRVIVKWLPFHYQTKEYLIGLTKLRFRAVQ
jgi:hypothetical protein